MKAELLPLDGKYYGTIIRVENNGCKYDIELWNTCDFVPSTRELGDICTVEEWKANKWLPDVLNGWTGEYGMTAKEYFDFCDSHFESQNAYETALAIVKMLNTKEAA